MSYFVQLLVKTKQKISWGIRESTAGKIIDTEVKIYNYAGWARICKRLKVHKHEIFLNFFLT